MRPVWITHLGHALPGDPLPQSEMAAWIERRVRPGSNLDKLHRFATRSGVDTRHSVLDLLGHDGEDFYPEQKPWPDAGVRNRIFASHALPLALAAVRNACPEGIPAGITHLVVATCTGAVAPGLDIQLVEALGLGPRVRRTVVGFMGCYAAIPALRVARDACAADPAARALVVCCELGSLHFQPGPADDELLAACLFGDGAGAAVLRASDEPAGLGLRFAGDAARLIPHTTGEMAWEAGPQGFLLRLSPTVARALGADLDPLTEELLGGRAIGDCCWAIHPGGPRIVEAVGRRLGLDGPALTHSLAALAAGGNRSSATVLDILGRHARAGITGACALVAFGPGLSAEALLVERVA